MSRRGPFSVATEVAIALFCTLLLALTVLLFFMCRKNRVTVDVGKEKGQKAVLPPPISVRAQAITFRDVDVATDGFNPRHVLGKGCLGTVYKANSSNGFAVVVKRIYPQLVLGNAGSASGFAARVRSLSLAQHPNVVPIVGYSEAPGERIIVTDFAGTKSLHSHLHQDMVEHLSSVPLLDWAQRVRIAAGAARGIEYLHEGTAPSIVHGLINSRNIMVDDDTLNARVCDYGLSFLAPLKEENSNSSSKASDVYGFGLVLLELLSGRRCCEEEEKMGFDWVLDLIRGSRVVEVLDPRIGLPSDVKPLERLAKVASACVGNGSKCRPSIVQVASILNNVEMLMHPVV